MSDASATTRQVKRTMPRDALRQFQRSRLNNLLAAIIPSNRFWSHRLAPLSLPLESVDELANLPITTKQDLVDAAATDHIRLLTYPLDSYTRVHRTSGTKGDPYYVYDTPDDWQWWLETWQYVLDAASVAANDRAVMAFSYGPFIGFWSAHDALQRRGTLVIPTGGMSSLARLQCIRDMAATVVCCTPTYALRLLEVAEAEGFDLASLPVRAIIVAGEPGGSDPVIRGILADGWHADVIDHAGATEIGPWGFPSTTRDGLHVIEAEFIAEFVTPTGDHFDPRDRELVLTSLGRYGMPVIRYRTGDLVRPEFVESMTSSETTFVFLRGGVLGRVDDMLTVRGVNVYPSTVEAIVRQVDSTGEFRLCMAHRGALQELTVQVEADSEQATRIAELLRSQLNLRVNVTAVPRGTFERFEGKARRVLVMREGTDDVR